MKNMNRIGMIIVITFFALFLLFTVILLDKNGYKPNSKNINVDNKNPIVEEENNNTNSIEIVNNLYQDMRILYDVVNNKFKVSQEDIINIGDVTYKKITNFNEVINSIFTNNGMNKYISDMSNYFANMDNDYYLAGNLVSYQTYYFRGDNTKIFILSSSSEEINAIIYEKWTSNNKNTLATIKVINDDNKWLIDDVNILATE